MRSLVALALLALPVSGCLGFGDDGEDLAPAADDLSRLVGNATADAISARVAQIPRNYTFPEQRTLPQVTLWKNGTIDSSAVAAYEDRNDRGGNHYGVVTVAEDYAGVVPAGQAVEIQAKLAMAMGPGSSADVDIFVDVPGTRTDFDPSSQDEFNWKFTAKHRSVSTVGVAGAPMQLGVSVANARVAPGQDLAYSLQLTFTYVEDVLTPHHAWAFEVPEEAGGLVFEAVKGDGAENVVATFVVLDPADEPVGVVTLNDLSVSTVFVPVRGAGTYVFYAWEMTGGFLSMQADVPVPVRDVRTLGLTTTPTSIGAGPAPGLPARDWMHDGSVVTPGSDGGTASFSVAGTFPLRIVPTIGDGATGAAEVRISNANGLVAALQRLARVDQGGNSLGYTQDEYNSEFHPAALAKGEYSVAFTNDSPATELGYTILTYAR